MTAHAGGWFAGRPPTDSSFHPGRALADTVPVELLLLFVAVPAAIGLVVWWQYERAQRRRAGLFSVAATLAFQFSGQDPFGLTHLPFWLFTQGDGQGAENVLWGEWKGLPLTLADFWYYEESSDSKGRSNRSYRHFSVAVAEFDWMVPRVCVRPEGVTSRLADHLGFRDLQFESEEFNRCFQVEADEREFAYQLLDQRMVAWLAPLEGFGFETMGRWLLVWSDRLEPDDLMALLAAVKGFRDRIPRMVWNEHGTGLSADREERSAP